MNKIFVSLVCLLWVGALVSRADTHYVSLAGTNDSGHNYDTWSGAATNIQWAVDAAAATVDTVLVSNGTYNLTNQISIAKNITVQSLYGTNSLATSSIINGNYPNYTNRCVYITNVASAILDGFIISNGYALGPTKTIYDGGGGVQIKTAGTVRNCLIYGNNANGGTLGGGGICLNGGGLVSNCTVLSNTVGTGGVQYGGGVYMSAGLMVASRICGNVCNSQHGGGVYVDTAGIISNCTVYNNSSEVYDDGGIYATGAGSIITDCVISNNTSKRYNGGVEVTYGAWILNSIITRNRSKDGGGGAVSRNPDSLMSNCLVTANFATNSIGGVSLSGSAGSSRILNSTIAGNAAGTFAGGLSAGAGAAGTFSGLVQNCLIYGNTNWGTDGGGGVYLNRLGPYPFGLVNCTIVSNQSNTKGGGLYTTTYSNYIANCIIYGNVTTNDDNDEVYVNTAAGTNNFWCNCTPNMLTNLPPTQGNIINNPLFVDAVNRNYRLRSGSPCINTGTNILIWMTNSIDLDRMMRIRYGRVDMGAYETIYGGTMYGFR